jgi:hypothetical protein
MERNRDNKHKKNDRDDENSLDERNGLGKAVKFPPLFLMAAMPPYSFDEIIPQVVQKLSLRTGCGVTTARKIDR